MFAATFAAAHYAVSHPHSAVGQVVFRCSQLAARITPVTGIYSGCQSNCAATDAGSEMSKAPDAGAVPITETAPPAAIHIPDDEPIPAAPMPIGVESRSATGELVVLPLPGEDHGLVAPLYMPYCGEELCEPTGGALELLPMPKIDDEDGEEQEAHEEPGTLGGVHPMLRLFEKALRKGIEAAPTGVDTMEHRPGDRPAHEYGKGPF